MTSPVQHPALVLFCGKSVQTIFHDKGSQSWVVDRNRLKRIGYAVLVRNHNRKWADTTQPHGAAFMVVKIKGVIPSSEEHCPERWNVLFDEYAEVSKLKAWNGDRNPVRYRTLEDFGFSPNTLDWKLRPDVERPEGPICIEDGSDFEPETAAPSTSETMPGIMDFYRNEIALRVGVKPEAVRISVDF